MLKHLKTFHLITFDKDSKHLKSEYFKNEENTQSEMKYLFPNFKSALCLT